MKEIEGETERERSEIELFSKGKWEKERHAEWENKVSSEHIQYDYVSSLIVNLSLDTRRWWNFKNSRESLNRSRGNCIFNCADVWRKSEILINIKQRRKIEAIKGDNSWNWRKTHAHMVFSRDFFKKSRKTRVRKIYVFAITFWNVPRKRIILIRSSILISQYFHRNSTSNKFQGKFYLKASLSTMNKQKLHPNSLIQSMWFLWHFFLAALVPQ